MPPLFNPLGASLARMLGRMELRPACGMERDGEGFAKRRQQHLYVHATLPCPLSAVQKPQSQQQQQQQQPAAHSYRLLLRELWQNPS
ncbi:unnamed protein product [Lampetra fluviatilis]